MTNVVGIGSITYYILSLRPVPFSKKVEDDDGLMAEKWKITLSMFPPSRVPSFLLGILGMLHLGINLFLSQGKHLLPLQEKLPLVFKDTLTVMRAFEASSPAECVGKSFKANSAKADTALRELLVRYAD